MKYAVIKTGGKQYKVSEGDVIQIDKLQLQKNQKIEFDVLLVVSDGKTEIGNPLVKGAKVIGKLLETKKGDKIRVAKFKAKSRYRRVMGFRPQISVVQIEKIEN